MMFPGSQVVPPVVQPAGEVGAAAGRTGVGELAWRRSAEAGSPVVTAAACADPLVGAVARHPEAGVWLLLPVRGAGRGPLEPRITAPARTSPATASAMTAPTAFIRPVPARRRASGRPGRVRRGGSVRSSVGRR